MRCIHGGQRILLISSLFIRLHQVFESALFMFELHVFLGFLHSNSSTDDTVLKRRLLLLFLHHVASERAVVL